MSISIYYEAKRTTELSSAEKQKVQEIVDKYSMDKAIEKFMETGEGLNWESFGFYEEPYDPFRVTLGMAGWGWTGTEKHWKLSAANVTQATFGQNVNNFSSWIYTGGNISH